MFIFFKTKKINPFLVAASLMVILLLAMLSCNLAFNTQDSSEKGSRAIISPNDFTSTVYAPDNKGVLKTNSAGKKFLHLEGSAYAMGYQHGYLLAANVQRMISSDFVMSVLANYLDISVAALRAKIGTAVENEIIATLRAGAKSFEGSIPAEFKEEMKGIYDGARAKGYNINYDDLLVNNLAFDILLGIAYPILAPILGVQALSAPHMCDGFIAFGNATSDGRTLMGRNFMFTDAIIHEEMFFAEYYPGSGNKFVSPTLPGWVGLVSGMNIKGIGIGCDMSPAFASDVTSVGMGSVLALRRALQYSNTLTEGINSIKSAKLGISWIIAIGSGINEVGGVVIETSATRTNVRSANYKYPSLYNLVPGLPRQIENKSDLLVFANHFIIPEMVILSGNPAIKDSVWRYETLTNLLLNNYGKVDSAKGRQIVNYLCPPAYDGYYGTNPDASVRGSRTLYDLKNLEIWSLYGHYNDQWIDYKF